jgi:hypothetical protein
MSGTIIFTEWRPPPLQAGAYELTVTQALSHGADTTAGAYIKEGHTTVRRFTVRGERWSLDPTELLAVFPPNNNNGEYHNVLPHAVFYRRTLPWERSPELGVDHESWLAVLLFEEDEAPKLQNVQVGDLMRDPFPHSADDPTTAASTLGATTACYGDGFAALAKKFDKPALRFELEQGEQLYDACQIIDIPFDLFAKIAPSGSDLKWLAHVRAVSSEKKAGASPGDSQENSVVVGNRLPRPNGKCIAHLVSLEGMSVFLPADDGSLAAIKANGQTATAIRLVSLASWSFTSVDPQETFDQYLEQLHLDAFQRPPVNLDTEVGKAVANAFRLGYTALKHQTRLGDITVSWMRGPLLPLRDIAETIVQPPAEDGSGVISAADQAMRFNPKTGMADISYAAAWQLGRLLGLQSGIFSVALYNWKRAAVHKTAQAVEHLNLMVKFSALLPQAAAHKVSAAAMANSPPPNGSLAGAIVALLRGGVTSGKPSSVSAAVRRMAALMPRASYHAQITALVANRAELAEVHEKTPVPPEVTEWLKDLVKLKGVPFGYLVPDEAMLPIESMRMFRLDGNWINALIEGACSIGRSSSADLSHDAVLVEKLYEATAAPKLVTGFLLRSAVVDGWPGLEVKAHDAANNSLRVVRMDRLAPNLLLFMVEGEIDHIEIHEPAEGLHFGVDLSSCKKKQNEANPAKKNKDTKDMRYITVPTGAPKDARPGTQIANPTAFATVNYRDPNASQDDARVIRIADFAQQAQKTVEDNNANNDGDKKRNFTSAEFAVELVEGVQLVKFQRGSK